MLAESVDVVGLVTGELRFPIVRLSFENDTSAPVPETVVGPELGPEPDVIPDVPPDPPLPAGQELGKRLTTWVAIGTGNPPSPKESVTGTVQVSVTVWSPNVATFSVVTIGIVTG